MVQVLGQGVLTQDMSAVHNLLLTALFAPGHLGMPPAEASSARKLALKARVCFSFKVVGSGYAAYCVSLSTEHRSIRCLFGHAQSVQLQYRLWVACKVSCNIGNVHR